MRTFIAIDLDEQIKKNLISFISELDKQSREGRGIRWIKPKGMHLTLKFLGEISGEKVPEIENALKSISEKYKSFVLKFKGTGSFPPASRNPRVLWIGIGEEETLIALQFHLERELENLGFPRESPCSLFASMVLISGFGGSGSGLGAGSIISKISSKVL